MSNLVAGCAETRPLVVNPATQVTRKAARKDAVVEMEAVDVHLTLRADGTWKRVYKNRYKILDQSAVESWSHSSAAYTPWYTKKPIVEATVTNVGGDGQVRKVQLDPTLINEEPAYPQAPDIYGDARVVRAPLPQVTLGSVIEETITTESHKPFLHPANLHRVFFDSGYPVKKVRFVIDAPTNMKLKFEIRDASVERSERKKDGRTQITFEGGPFEALKPLEDFLPTDVTRWPYVAVSTGHDWETLARAYHEVVESALAGIDFASTVRSIVKDSDTDQVKMSKILQWVKERVRYVGVELGDSAVVPHAPDKTIARGFGDCKDQATLLVGLLRAAGLEANVSLLLAGTGEDILPNLPALNVFNHAIVHVGGKHDLFIDSTGDFFSLGNLPGADQGRFTLIANDSTSGLTKTPGNTPDMNTYTEERLVSLGTVGFADITETSRGTGFFDTTLRSSFSAPEEQLQKNLEQYVEHSYDAKGVTGVVHSDPFSLRESFSGTLVAKESKIAQTGLLLAHAELREAFLLQWLPGSLLEGEEARESPLFVGSPYSAEVHWKVAPPKDYVITDAPKSEVIDFGVGSLERAVSKSEEMFTMRTAFALEKANLTAKEVNDFREAYAEWGRTSVQSVSYHHRAWDAAQRGEIESAIRFLRDDLADQQAEARTRMRMAFVLRPYLEETAIEEAKKAIELEPNDVANWEDYAAFVTENPTEQDLGAGFLREEALRAYRRIYELDEDKLYAKLRHAVVLEHTQEGHRYSTSQADLKKAIAIYDSVPAKELREFEDGTFKYNALFTLFWAGEYEELRERMKKLPAGEAPQVLLVNNAAALGGSELALQEIKRLNLQGDERAELLESASSVLVRAGDYAGAAAVLEAVGGEGDSATKLKTRATMLRTLKRLKLQDLSMSEPVSFVQRFMAAAPTQDEDSDDLAKEYLSKDAYLQGKDSPLVATLENLRQDLPPLLSKEFMRDLMIAGGEIVVDGNDRVGYRVKFSFKYGGEATSTMYLVREGKELRLRSVGNQLTEIGAEALSAYQAGHKQKAEQWLNWAREVLHVPSGEDPLRVPPFGRLWNDGKGDAQLAAAALAVSSAAAPRAKAVILANLSKEQSTEHRHALMHALLGVYSNSEEHEKYLEAARNLYREFPKSKNARDSLLAGLWKTRRLQEYQKEVETLLEKARNGKERLEFRSRLAQALEHQSRFVESRKLRKQIIAEHPNAHGQYNSLGWSGLVVGSTEEDVKYVLRSLEAGRNVGRLHSLACLYADLGQLSDAQHILTEIRRARKDNKLTSIDWYIVGRIAEQLGFSDSARRAYKRVERPEGFYSPTSTYSNAQARLKKL